MADHLGIINLVADMEDKRAACQRARELRAAASYITRLRAQIETLKARVAELERGGRTNDEDGSP